MDLLPSTSVTALVEGLRCLPLTYPDTYYPQVTFIQVVHTALDCFFLEKYYVEVIPMKEEIVFDRAFTPVCINKERNNEVQSFDMEGNLLHTYQRLPYNPLVLRELPSGDEYYPGFWTTRDLYVDRIRRFWMKHNPKGLFCYSIKHDGRYSFYPIIKKPLPAYVDQTGFHKMDD
jgi:hypothetical protein